MDTSLLDGKRHFRRRIGYSFKVLERKTRELDLELGLALLGGEGGSETGIGSCFLLG